jgi:predicted nuclease of predicted toxin-antitoxin system
MKFLFDQNISFRIIKKIHSKFSDSKQIRQVGLEGLSDFTIWNYAKENNFTIVTFDSDFYDLSLIKGIPPKVIWLRTGNTTTNNIVKLLTKNFDLIDSFINDPKHKDIGCLEID